MFRIVVGAAAAAVCCGCVLWQGETEPGTKLVNAFDLSAASAGMGKKVEARGNGFVTHPESAVVFRMNGKVKSFDGEIVIAPEAAKEKKSGREIKAVCRIWTDGKIVWNSGVFGEKSEPVKVHVDLLGAEEVILETTSTAPWVAYEATIVEWRTAVFSYESGAVLESVTDPKSTMQLGILTPPVSEEPVFNGAEVWGVRPGHPVIFRVPVSGVRPMSFSAKGLPAGVTFDAKRGVLGGVAPQAKGEYPIVITADNAKGSATKTITLNVGDTICLTPPMGWNSWNIWGSGFTGDHAKAAAKALDASGLADFGFAYINLDDFWEMNNSKRNTKRPELRGAARDKDGMIISNPSFPDMKGLTDYIHSFGFKAGLYSSPGPETCGGCEGSWQHEAQDAKRWADWGFDYVKYDWCSYGDIYHKETGRSTWDGHKNTYHDAFAKPYRLMGDCLRKQNRDIVYSFCQYGLGEVQKWGRDAGANCWRSWQDLKDTWPWMEVAFEGYVPNVEFYKYVGPGFWADPDMMIVGNQRSFGSTHPTFVTPNEQYTHVSLWCMIGSPLLIGTDLTKLDDFTKNLLMNHDVIAISQDTLGMVARRAVHDDLHSVWERPLANGDNAVAIVNRCPVTRTFKVDLKKLGLGGEYVARDCWRQVGEGVVSGEYVAEIPPHATKLIRLARVKCSRCE